MVVLQAVGHYIQWTVSGHWLVVGHCMVADQWIVVLHLHNQDHPHLITIANLCTVWHKILMSKSLTNFIKFYCSFP